MGLHQLLICAGIRSRGKGRQRPKDDSPPLLACLRVGTVSRVGVALDAALEGSMTAGMNMWLCQGRECADLPPVGFVEALLP